jgi:hypothetical protein
MVTGWMIGAKPRIAEMRIRISDKFRKSLTMSKLRCDYKNRRKL